MRAAHDGARAQTVRQEPSGMIFRPGPPVKDAAWRAALSADRSPNGPIMHIYPGSARSQIDRFRTGVHLASLRDRITEQPIGAGPPPAAAGNGNSRLRGGAGASTWTDWTGRIHDLMLSFHARLPALRPAGSARRRPAPGGPPRDSRPSRRAPGQPAKLPASTGKSRARPQPTANARNTSSPQQPPTPPATANDTSARHPPADAGPATVAKLPAQPPAPDLPAVTTRCGA